MDKWRRSAFLDNDDDPLGPMANLVDIILVFACGLIAALVSFSPELQKHFDAQQREVTSSRELSDLPESVQNGLQTGQGLESMGQVYRDPKTDKLILIGD